MNNQDNFQKIPVKKNIKVTNRKVWQFNRKIERKIKQKQQEKFYAKG